MDCTLQLLVIIFSVNARKVINTRCEVVSLMLSKSLISCVHPEASDLRYISQASLVSFRVYFLLTGNTKAFDRFTPFFSPASTDWGCKVIFYWLTHLASTSSCFIVNFKSTRVMTISDQPKNDKQIPVIKQQNTHFSYLWLSLIN